MLDDTLAFEFKIGDVVFNIKLGMIGCITVITDDYYVVQFNNYSTWCYSSDIYLC